MYINSNKAGLKFASVLKHTVAIPNVTHLPTFRGFSMIT